MSVGGVTFLDSMLRISKRMGPVRTSHILLKVGNGITDKESYDAICEIRDAIKQGKASFAEMAELYSEGPSGKAVHEKKKTDLFLFRINDIFENDLNDGNISEDLREAFENKGYPLSQNTTVEVEQESREWTINDEESGKKYTVIDAVIYVGGTEMRVLNIYEGELNGEKLRKKGDLDYFGPGVAGKNDKGEIVGMVKEFEDASYSLTKSHPMTDEPIKTSFGYHLIKLEGKVMVPFLLRKRWAASLSYRHFLVEKLQNNKLNNLTE